MICSRAKPPSISIVPALRYWKLSLSQICERRRKHLLTFGKCTPWFATSGSVTAIWRRAVCAATPTFPSVLSDRKPLANAQKSRTSTRSDLLNKPLSMRLPDKSTYSNPAVASNAKLGCTIRTETKRGLCAARNSATTIDIFQIRT